MNSERGNAGPCLCGDPLCGRCFPQERRRFVLQDLSDAVAAWAYGQASPAGPSSLDALDAADVASLIELAIQAVRVKTFGRPGRELDAALDSELAGRIVDLIRDTDTDEAVRAAER